MSGPRRLGKRQHGVALLMVLLCLAMVSLSLAGLAEHGRRDLSRLGEWQARTQADFYARGAEVIAQRALTDATGRQAGLGWQGLAGRTLAYPTDHGQIRLRVEDLRGCFNLNSLAGPDAALAERQLSYYFSRHLSDHAFPDGLPTNTFLSLLADWVDSDSLARSGSLDGPDYARLVDADLGPRTSADVPLADISEVNWLHPRDSQRFRHLPEGLCATPDTGPLKLSLNAIPVERFDLLDALLEGRVPRSRLEGLLRSRPTVGYDDIEQVRSALGKPDDFDDLAQRLMLTTDLLRLHIQVQVGEHYYHYIRLLEAEGVSPWQPRVAASQVRVLQRHRGSFADPPFPSDPPKEPR